ncbi:MAG: hypothetical protein BYD32DRAFT_413111 [Podila humilis]|nr:MAG: hypothetical protein BYD32DRAFT_413111 [Podila humilis]
MLGSIPFIVGTIALAMAPLAHAQTACGGQLTGNGIYFSVTQTPNFSILTMANNDANINRNESYILYCTDAPPSTLELLPLGYGGSYKNFRIPLAKVMVDDNYTSTYIELVRQRNTITILSNPQNIVSPCLQQGVTNNSITTMTADETQYSLVNATFREDQHPEQPKDIWMPHSVDIHPLARADYVRAVSLFFNQGAAGQTVYDQIAAAYNQHRDNMEGIPGPSKRRIGWIRYDFSTSHWTLRNSNFTRALIEDAGGQPFPLCGTAEDNSMLTTDEVRTLILNSQVLIDQTEYPSTVSPMPHIRQTAFSGFVGPIPVLDNRNVYSLDFSRNFGGSNDYNYRMAARPDLLMKDMIRSQYPAYQPSIGDFTFFNKDYGSSTPQGSVYSAANCSLPDASINNAPYFDEGILPIPVGSVPDVSPAPPPPSGSGIYGGSCSDAGAGKSKSKVGIIVGVIVAATVMAAGFAFAFFKWGKRAKEDRFIELEEEMNNEIPLH